MASLKKILGNYQETDKLLQNDTMIDLETHICCFFGYMNEENYNSDQKHDNRWLRGMKNNNFQDVVKALRKSGLKVVAFNSRKAKNPKYIVVTETGIQTPFYLKTQVGDIVTKIGNSMRESGIAIPFSYYWGIRAKQLTSPPKGGFRSKVSKNSPHPDAAVFDNILKKRGENFFEDMIQEAFDISSKDKRLYNYFSQPQDLDSSEDYFVFNGRPYILEPEYIHAQNNMESRSVIFGTLSYERASLYAMQPWKKKNRPLLFGFVHVYKGIKNPRIYADSQMELGESAYVEFPENWAESELAIVPGKNKLLKTLICFEKQCFEIPPDDERWKDFKELLRVGYNDTRPYMVTRRANIIDQFNYNYQKPVCYDEKALVKIASIDRKHHISLLASARKGLLKRLDGLLGTKMTDTKLPRPLKREETKFSFLLYRIKDSLRRK